MQEGVPDGIWKSLADSHYLEKAKAALWKACGENLGTITNRQGDNKKKKEIDDIHDGLRKLKDESKLPLILATSRMAARAPPYRVIHESSKITDVVSKVKDLEECMGAFIKKQNDQMKELTEIVAVNACQNKPHGSGPSARLLKEQSNLETPRTKKRRMEDEQPSNEPSAPPAEEDLGHQEKVAGATNNYAAAAAASNQSLSGITPLNQKRFRKKSVLVYGKATTGKDDREEILAADVELVATGVAKDATTEQLKECIVAKGIDVLEIKKLTTFEQARTNTFKIKIKAAQYTKAMDPDIWPLRVGVRHYRQPRREQNTGTSWNEQADKSGGVINQNQQNKSFQNTQIRYQQNQYHQQSQGPPQYPNQHQRYYQQPQGNPVYQQQYQRPPQYPHHRQENLDIQNRFVVDGFSNDVYN